MPKTNVINNIKNKIKSIVKISSAALLLNIGLFATYVQATTVEFQTSQGNFEVNLYDESTPATVANFLNYVNAGSYTNTVFHRSIPNFIIQGGGFIFEGSTTLTPIATNATVINEPVWSSVQGTIAMAKPGNDANGATNQWFFNTQNNSSDLDTQNNGFTVFGQVTGDGMDIINTIAAQPRCSFTTLFSDVPMIEAYNCAVGSEPGSEDYITVYSIAVLDSTVNTVDGLTQVPNTLINNTDNDNNSTDSSGGTFYWLILLGFSVFSFRSYRK